MDTIRITTAQNIDIDYEVAGLGERIVARIIDIALFVVIFILGLIFAGSVFSSVDSSIGIVCVIAIYAGLFVFYDLLCEIFMNGQSIGKRVLKIKVISLNGTQPTIGQYLLRWLFRIVDFTLTGQLGALITTAVSEKNQRIGDMVAGTTLIKTNPRTHIDHVSYMAGKEEYEIIFKEAGSLSEKDVALIQDVINTYVKTKNSVLVYNMAKRIREHLGIVQPPEMNDMKFLQTIVKDYGYMVSAQADAI